MRKKLVTRKQKGCSRVVGDLSTAVLNNNETSIASFRRLLNWWCQMTRKRWRKNKRSWRGTWSWREKRASIRRRNRVAADIIRLILFEGSKKWVHVEQVVIVSWLIPLKRHQNIVQMSKRISRLQLLALRSTFILCRKVSTEEQLNWLLYHVFFDVTEVCFLHCLEPAEYILLVVKVIYGDEFDLFNFSSLFVGIFVQQLSVAASLFRIASRSILTNFISQAAEQLEMVSTFSLVSYWIFPIAILDCRFRLVWRVVSFLIRIILIVVSDDILILQWGPLSFWGTATQISNLDIRWIVHRLYLFLLFP